MSNQSFVYVVINERHTNIYAKVMGILEEFLKEFPGDIGQLRNDFYISDQIKKYKDINLGIIVNKVNAQEIRDKLLIINKKIHTVNF